MAIPRAAEPAGRADVDTVEVPFTSYEVPADATEDGTEETIGGSHGVLVGSNSEKSESHVSLLSSISDPICPEQTSSLPSDPRHVEPTPKPKAKPLSNVPPASLPVTKPRTRRKKDTPPESHSKQMTDNAEVPNRDVDGEDEQLVPLSKHISQRQSKTRKPPQGHQNIRSENVDPLRSDFHSDLNPPSKPGKVLSSKPAGTSKSSGDDLAPAKANTKSRAKRRDVLDALPPIERRRTRAAARAEGVQAVVRIQWGGGTTASFEQLE
ncbi:hypothetical protein HKX48_003054 [Thoreauomyces humboldtii]|nr:hypothetical protein HKX48_003054 [Thoreauomyces humboldtii]